MVQEIYIVYITYGNLLCCTDHDERNGCTYELYGEEKLQKLGERVKAPKYMEDRYLC